MSTRNLIALAAVGLVLSSCSGGGGATSAAALVPILSNINTSLQEHESTLNGAGSDRIHQVAVEIDGLLGEAKKYGTDFNNATSDQREQFVSNAFELIQQSADLTDRVGSDVTSDINRMLIGEAAALQAIPFSPGQKPLVLGLEPLAVPDVSKDVTATAFVFIPKRFNAQDIRVYLNTKELSAEQYVDQKLAFYIPGGTLKADQMNHFDVVFERPRTFQKPEQVEIGGDIQALNPKPFTCGISVASLNPASTTTVTGNWDLDANSGQSTVDRTATAKELFTTIIPNYSKYLPDSAQIISASGAVLHASKPCACGNDPSAGIKKTTPDNIEVILNAPNTGAGRICGSSLFKKYICGGGGSNITYRVTPVFEVGVAGQPEAVTSQTMSVQLARKGIAHLNIKDQHWTEIDATCVYQNGPTTASSHMALPAGRTIQGDERVQLIADKSGVYVQALY